MIPEAADTRSAALVAALKAARASLGWSQKDLAVHSGISKVTIARMEAGMMSPRLSTVSALQVAMEKFGVYLALNDPSGGFTLRVEAKALDHPRPNADSKDPSKPPLRKVSGATASFKWETPQRDLSGKGRHPKADWDQRPGDRLTDPGATNPFRSSLDGTVDASTEA